ncbi:MAG: hypothetical protein JSV26_10690 [bacterium]|nr:MAG: hypothetical protein JSV26_10690 [bacterium]
MRKILLFAVLLTVTLVPAAQARTKLVALPGRDATTIRFDNPAATLVEEERVLTLQEGENMVDFSWKGVQIDPDSIRLSIISHPEEVTLLSVSYPPGEQALVWRINSTGAWEERVRISYLLSFIDRLITYKGVASKDERVMDLDAFLVLRNFSGEDFRDAEFVLGQGKPFSGSLAHEETRQIRFMSAQNIPIRKTYTWDSRKQPWEPKRMERDVGIPVHYLIENSGATGLGAALMWEGKARIFQDDGQGGNIFLGEDRVGITPVGEVMRVYIGDSRDVAVTQHKKVDRVINPRPSRHKVVLYDTEEEIQTAVENFKDQPVKVDVIQHIPGEWDMADTSQPYEKKDSSTIVYSVEVAPKGKKQLTFRYHRRNVRGQGG